MHWYDVVVPDLAAGRITLVVAHGNSLRALVKHLDGISDADIAELNIPTGMPLVYELDDGFRPDAAGRAVPGSRGGGSGRGGGAGSRALSPDLRLRGRGHPAMRPPSRRDIGRECPILSAGLPQLVVYSLHWCLEGTIDMDTRNQGREHFANSGSQRDQAVGATRPHA